LSKAVHWLSGTEPPGVCLLAAIIFPAFVMWAIYMKIMWSEGARWLLASEIGLLLCMFLLFAGSVAVFAIQPKKRWVHYAGGGICLAMTLALVISLPTQLQDAFGPLDTEIVTIVSSNTSSNGTVELWTADGRTLRYAEAYGIATYDQPRPGIYELTETRVLKRVVQVRPVD
jgi:hypothetical protein